MPIVHDKYTRNGRKFNITETGQKIYKAFIGQKNINLGNGDFAPYIWDEPSSGSQDSPELNSFIQQRIDGNDVTSRQHRQAIFQFGKSS